MKKIIGLLSLLAVLGLSSHTPSFATEPSTQAAIDSKRSVETDAKIKEEMSVLREKIKTQKEKVKAEREKIKQSREKMKPDVEKLKANTDRMKELRAKMKAKHDEALAKNGDKIKEKLAAHKADAKDHATKQAPSVEQAPE